MGSVPASDTPVVPTRSFINHSAKGGDTSGAELPQGVAICIQPRQEVIRLGQQLASQRSASNRAQVKS
jgi:hypothetical protein